MALKLCSSCNYLTTTSNDVSNEGAYHTHQSTYNNFLQSNVSLDDNTKEDVRSLLDSLLPRLGDINREISRLEDLLDHARRERAAIASSIDLCHAVSAPIRSLPNETLSEIFYATIPPLDRMSMACMPWAASQVCTRWRSIALSTPRLWPYVSFTVSEHSEYEWDEGRLDPSKKENRLQVFSSRLQQYLARSLNTSLSIDINIHITPHTTGMNPVAIQILEQLVAECDRWEVARLYLYSDACRAVVSKVKGRLPRLRSLYLSSPLCLDFFSVAPCLQSFSVSALSTRMMPWSQIVRLAIAHVDVSTWMTFQGVLESCTRLEELAVSFVSAIRSTESSFMISLPFLTHLRCHWRLCSAISVPKLQTLQLSSRELNPETDISAVISGFLRRSTCQLQDCILDLTVKNDIFNIIQLVAPVLSQLVINISNENIVVVDDWQFTINQLYQTQLPHLQILGVSVDRHGAQIVPLLVPVIQAWKSSAPLLKVIIENWDKGKKIPAVDEVVAQLRQEEIEVELSLEGKLLLYNVLVPSFFAW